jgi:hypothetical protein
MQNDLKKNFRKCALIYVFDPIHSFKSKSYLPQSHQIFCDWQIHSVKRQELVDKKNQRKAVDTFRNVVQRKFFEDLEIRL